MINIITDRRIALDEFEHMLRGARGPKLRTMREFAESEVVLPPDGPFHDTKFHCDRQPWSRLYFDCVDSGLWNRHVATGPSQSGKTLTCFIIPIMYHLFEVKESIVVGVPLGDMIRDKWHDDIKPVIQASQYRDLIPTSGPGSRDGTPNRIEFLNGTSIRFMTAGGSDKTRAGKTTRVLIITETDGFDEISAKSRESDKVEQLQARKNAWGDRWVEYQECTVSIETGTTWTEYTNGTESKILIPCPECKEFVHLERKHLVGWQEETSEPRARKESRWLCPECAAIWNDDERRTAVRQSIILHSGQRIGNDGAVEGTIKETETLGFRWTAVDNLLMRAGDIGLEEWKAVRAEDNETKEVKMRQFYWTLPKEPQEIDLTDLSISAIITRTSKWNRGIVPDDAEYVTAALDLGKYVCHWTVIAARWLKAEDDRLRMTPHIVDYGVIDVHSRTLGELEGLKIALQEFGDMARVGWPMSGTTQEPAISWIDMRGGEHWADEVYEFCKDANGKDFAMEGFMPYRGLGQSQSMQRKYTIPKAKTATTRHVGDGYHVTRYQKLRACVVEGNADHWKSWLAAALRTPLDKPGAMTLYGAVETLHHFKFAQHITAEEQKEEFEAGKGLIITWKQVRRQNHWLDTTYMACAAAHYWKEREGKVLKAGTWFNG